MLFKTIIYENSSYVNQNTRIFRKIVIMKTPISVRIKEIRTDRNLTQEQFGKLLNTSQDTVSLWEKGKSTPNADQIICLADYSKFHKTAFSSFLPLEELDICVTNAAVPAKDVEFLREKGVDVRIAK